MDDVDFSPETQSNVDVIATVSQLARCIMIVPFHVYHFYLSYYLYSKRVLEILFLFTPS